jgi:hypothetical protein
MLDLAAPAAAIGYGVGRISGGVCTDQSRLYWGMSNAQVAALGSVVVVMVVARKKPASSVEAYTNYCFLMFVYLFQV